MEKLEKEHNEKLKNMAEEYWTQLNWYELEADKKERLNEWSKKKSGELVAMLQREL